MGNCLASQESSIIGSLTNKINSPVKTKSTKVSSNGPTQPKVGKIIKPRLIIFTYSELLKATNNFKSDTIVGEGGFGRVYKGWIDEDTFAPSKPSVGVPIAIKRCKANSAQSIKEWKTEIEFLGKMSHPNLVKLLGFCWDEKELLLVYEYMHKGSLATHLFQQNRESLSWNTRIKIAIEAARGLDFLHTNEYHEVIFRDFKPANILLDQDYNAKLSDFGIARLGPTGDKSHVTTQAMGTYGYVAPEYMKTGHLYVKSDLYSFGVVLLELMTGLRAYDTTRPASQTDLVDWYRPMLSDMSKLRKIIDPRMQDYPPKAINLLAQLILKCVQKHYKNRPHMCDVLLTLEEINAIKIVPKGLKTTSSQHKRPIRSHPSHIHHHGSNDRSNKQVI